MRQKTGLALLRPESVLVLSLFLPWTFRLGNLALSPYRLVLIVLFFPILVRWIAGKARLLVSDVILLAYCGWASVSLFVIYDSSRATQSAGILLIETMGPYLVARVSIRTLVDFRNFARVFFLTIALLFPFALFEAVSGRDVLLDSLTSIVSGPVRAETVARWGLTRVQSVFEHPILFGVITGTNFALVYLVLGHDEPTSRRWMRAAIVGVTCSLSLSAGPISALFVQIVLLSWNWLLRANDQRWALLIGLLVVLVGSISLASNQTVPEFLITHFSFDQQSANFRVLIWTFGSASVLNHPWFGVGYESWDRPDWMPFSIDMFWLSHGIYYGLPAAILMMGFFTATIARLARLRLDGAERQCRLALVIVLAGLFVVGWTVQFWNATYVFFVLLCGSGSWLVDKPATRLEIGHAASPGGQGRRGTRAGPRRTMRSGAGAA